MTDEFGEIQINFDEPDHSPVHKSSSGFCNLCDGWLTPHGYPIYGFHPIPIFVCDDHYRQIEEGFDKDRSS
jgi:hypothetical protein